jgi:signal transduction histidine kinase
LEKENLYFNSYRHDNNKGLILLIEDLVETAEAISEYLTLEGFIPRVVGDAKQAIQFLTHEIPDLIISDINLPHRSGLDLFKETRMHPSWREIPFIFISSDNKDETKHLSLSLGADSFLLKPFEPKELKSVVEGKLVQFRNRQETEKTRFNTLKKRIIHTLSHEFRTPLVSITTGTELLIDEYKSLEDEQVQLLLKSILKGGQRLERLVEDFMLMQQIDIGYAAKSFEQCKCILPFSELISGLKNGIEELCNNQYPSAQVEYEISKESENLRVEVFTEQFLDALIRLVDNGLKFSSPDHKVKVQILKKDGDLVFKVRDWGRGISDAKVNLENLIIAFEQLDRERNEQQGCGLGLNIASYFFSLHKAKISLAVPDDGIGAEISIALKYFENINT